MNCVNKVITVLFLFAILDATAQSSDKLKKEQQRLEQKIANTKMLLEKSKSNTASSFNELKVIENQIKFREQLLRNFNNQIRGAELKVKDKEQEIDALYARTDKLKGQFKKLLLYAYKHRNKYGRIMFIFSADSYYEAVKRNKYLKRIADVQKKQFILIKQHQELIREQITEIEDEKQYKLLMISEKQSEKDAIEKDKLNQEAIYQKYKQEEESILAKLRKEERDREVLKNRIAEAIRKEIAEAEARRKREEAAAEAEAKASGTTVKETASFAETKEAAALSKSFEGNRGRLPWPVEKGTVTENFGKNPHPTLKNVYTNNRGIDISAPKNAQVRAVFEGEVTSVLNIPGAGKVVIIKHGNYRTVYTNLQDTYVKTGQKVSTKKVIGSLLAKDGQSISVAHFEIHKVVGSSVTCLNPSLWVAH